MMPSTLTPDAAPEPLHPPAPPAPPALPALPALPPPLAEYFAARGWTPFDFQRAAWAAYLRGRSGLLHAPTGTGKTLAAWLGPVIERLNSPTLPFREPPPSGRARARPRRDHADPLTVLWLTPLRALANDTAESLLEPVRELGLPWSVELRTGDTPSSRRARQKERLPTALVTTPESLTLLMSYDDSRQRFATLRCVVVDEWHELFGTKRGVQVELALARLRAWAAGAGGLGAPTGEAGRLRTWGVSATLGNLAEAMDVLLGASAAGDGVLVESTLKKEVEIATVLPEDPERFPWAGHLGTRSVDQVVRALNRETGTTLLFTNTRSQCELWFKRLIEERPDWLAEGRLAVHHGSLDRAFRGRVEAMLAEGRLRCVVCTSSLDLGVDFAPVDRVIQVGSPKGVGRLLQRAGRSGHRPGAPSRVLCVPAHGFELVEFAAVREAAAAGRVEARRPLDRPLDCLVQHLVTAALGGGFVEDELLREVRATRAFAALSDAEWRWAMDFVARGGPALTAYPQYAKIRPDQAGSWRAASPAIARLHRMNIGTIASPASVLVRYGGAGGGGAGGVLGTIEESFISKLAPGSRFVFAGRVVELVRVREMTAYVRRARSARGVVPRWDGGRMSLSTQLAGGVRGLIARARRGEFAGPEMQAARPILELQSAWSALPSDGELLIERCRIEAGRAGADSFTGLYVFPFEGRAVHEGMGELLARRLAARGPITLVVTSNDYGFGLHTPGSIDLSEHDWRALLSTDRLLDDLLACVNSTQMARRAFRDIARVAGLVVQSLPGASRPSRQLQASSEMFFDVLTDFDPGNLLLDQSRREVLEAQLEVSRLRSALERTAGQTLLRRSLDRLSPLAFPIWAETLRATQVSSERWSDLVARMVVRMERVADGSPPPTRADRADAAVGLPQGVWERAAGPQADLPTARGRGRRRDATPDPRPSQESGDPTARTHARS